MDDDDDHYLPDDLFKWFPVLVQIRNCLSLSAETSAGVGDFVIGNTQLVPLFDKSGRAYCGRPTVSFS